MLQLAQDMMKVLQERVRTTLGVMADLAESVGAPPAVTSMIHGLERMVPNDQDPMAGFQPPPPPPPRPAPAPSPTPVEVKPEPTPAAKKPARTKDHVRPLEVEDAINGSTYLARIVWSLGVAELEGTGPLRPADMARMIMSRSAVSLEPPNVARYIRRSKPTCIVVDHSEGNSNFYALNDEGHALFNEKFKRT
jgi:hypothetical protein